jgi:hypothetical protein
MSIVLVGSTSGSITLQEPAIAGTTVLDLPAVSGTLITTGSPQSGSVLQVVQAETSTEVSNSTNTFADTGLTATITPKFATSKILVLVNHSTNQKSNANADNSMSLRIVRGSTTISTFAQFLGYTNSSLLVYFSASYSYLDSPATTSATTYKTQFASSFGSAAVRVCSNSTPASITLLEIAA